MTAKQRAAAACDALEEIYPEAVCSLEYGGEGWKLLIMGRLSAQCTDERVNIVCRDLFERYPTAESIANADVSDIMEIVRPCGLYKTKAQNIVDSMRILCEQYGGEVPNDMEDLLMLPGVGRKIANLLLGDLYKMGGIVADTHCMRICGRLGFYEEGKKDPLFTERTMEKLVPTERQSDFCHRLVLFGREYCTASSPRCAECPLSEICKHHSTEKRREKK
jgi:endonuclease-3